MSLCILPYEYHHLSSFRKHFTPDGFADIYQDVFDPWSVSSFEEQGLFHFCSNYCALPTPKIQVV